MSSALTGEEIRSSKMGAFFLSLISSLCVPFRNVTSVEMSSALTNEDWSYFQFSAEIDLFCTYGN
jgi:hypothetical protein